MITTLLTAEKPIQYTTGQISAMITRRSDGAYMLRCTDYLTSEWAEAFDSLSLALARLALLVACEESGWELAFRFDAQPFQVAAQNFLSRQSS
jgi:hypothetical protein